MGILGFEVVNYKGYDLIVVDDGLNCTDCSCKLHEALDHFGDNTPLWFFRTDLEKHGYELTIVSDDYITQEALKICLEKWNQYATLITGKTDLLKQLCPQANEVKLEANEVKLDPWVDLVGIPQRNE